MLRACVAMLCTGTVYFMTVGSPDPSAPQADAAAIARPAPQVDRSCKPLAPVEVLLEQAGSSAGARLDLEWSIRPKRDVRSLRWQLELPEDGVWLLGERAGKAHPEHDALTRGEVSVSVPVDGLYREAVLSVRGIFEGSDETGATFDEPFEVVKTLSWGEPPAVAPLVLSPDTETGELTPFVALPTAHRKGR